LADFQRDFEQIIADENFKISFKAKRLMMYDEIQRCFTSDRIGKGHLYLPRFRKISDLGSGYIEEGVEPFIFDLVYSAPFLFGHPNKEETLKSVNELYDYCEQLSLKTAVQRHAENDEIDNKLEKLLSGNIFLGVLAPALARINEIAHSNKTELITAGYLRQLPIDSFSDKPLSYRKTEDNFILYSVGPNFTDEGGEYSRDSKGRIKNWLDNGDTVFWPVPKPQAKQ